MLDFLKISGIIKFCNSQLHKLALIANINVSPTFEDQMIPFITSETPRLHTTENNLAIVRNWEVIDDACVFSQSFKLLNYYDISNKEWKMYISSSDLDKSR